MIGRLLGVVVVSCFLAGCNARTVKKFTSLVGSNRGAEAANEDGNRQGRSQIERKVDQIVADNNRQLKEMQAYVNQQVSIGQAGVKAATPRTGNSTRRAKSSNSGGINTNPYID
jgi:hypothetical protein